MGYDSLIMWNIISYIKEIIIWSLPFYALHIYLKNTYHISLGQILVWWPKNFSNIESSTAIIVSFIFIFILFCLPITSLMNSFYLNLFGEKQTLIYLGNSSESTSVYYKNHDLKKKAFEGYNIDQAYNFSFNDINKSKNFIKDPGTTSIVGQKNKRLHITAVLSTFFFMMFFLIPVLGAIHAFSYPMYIDLNVGSENLQGEAFKAFETILLNFKVTKGYSVIILFGSLFLALFFSANIPDDKNSSRITPLPSYIKVGNKLDAVPIEINIAYSKKTNDDGSTTTYDSGFRNAIFKFDKGFSPSVYVALHFDGNKSSVKEDEIRDNINSKTKINLVIDDDLQLCFEHKLKLN